MKSKPPHHFEYHQYLENVLGAREPASNFFIATEKDFARGADLDYPYRSYFYVVALMHRGNCRLRVGINEYELRERTISMVGPGIVRSWVNNDWKATNHTVFFRPAFFQPPFSGSFLDNYVFFRPGANHAFQLLESDYRQAVSLVNQLEAYSKKPKVAQGIFFAFLEFINEVYTTVSEGISQNTKNQKISNQFAQLLQTHYQAHKEVSFYAEKLNLTPKTLSDILKKETGYTAKQSIEDFILFEAKCLLKQTDLSIKEIVYWLGYEDPSYFTKLFKSKVRSTPLTYRSS